MKGIIKIGCLIGIASAMSTASFGREWNNGSNSPQNGGGSKPAASGKAANCAPASKNIRLDFNDVSTLISNGGNMFIDNRVSPAVSSYEVPKTATGNGPKMLYSGSLWMGGRDVNGQLKIAALTYRQGEDFWPGPLSTQDQPDVNYDPRFPVGDDAVRPYGDANIDQDECVAYDQFWTISKGAVIQYSVWWEACSGPDSDPDVCETVETPSADVYNQIANWPAHPLNNGEFDKGFDHYLAPFYDRNQNTWYEPQEGEYPWYDDILGRDDVVCGQDRRVTLFGDYTIWWVFNDKGNIHTETNGDPIGMEIRAQAFAFATSDEINRMTFYNYEMINRGTQTLEQTYFAIWMDPDVGNYSNDYVGCDVSRGLGYAFNGELEDPTSGGNIGWGENAPAIGVDFFEGPYQDADFEDNPGPVFDTVSNQWVGPTVAEAIIDGGIVYNGIGIGYGDGIIDNERFGMRRFTFFNGSGGFFPYSDPTQANQYYNYMEGKWQDGSEMYYGGSGNANVTTIEADYMFPGDSDPLNWGTKGIDPGFDWDEVQADNVPADRRFVQAAGPFTLKPGATNNLTLGVVYGRSFDGDLMASVDVMKQADTKAQALFDACFRIISPPDAPRLTIQELENELILMIDNPSTSNNVNEGYSQLDDINIPQYVDDVLLTADQRTYNFEGYQIFQMVDDAASASDIGDNSKARLVAQCDIKNDIARIDNFEFDEELGFDIGDIKVEGENEGIRHTFKVTEDLFAQGDRKLVNHKTYYYVAIAYAYNSYKDYDPNDPEALNGQKLPYISSRLSYDGTAIKSIEAVPHNPMPESNGTGQLVEYGVTPEITRLDGHGNGNRVLEFTPSTLNTIVANGYMEDPTYASGFGPINVKVVDPLNVKGGYYTLEFNDYTPVTNSNEILDASWTVNRHEVKGGPVVESFDSDVAINKDNEQIIPEWGISIQISQTAYLTPEGTQVIKKTAEPIEGTLEFADSSKRWLTWVSDNDQFYPTNWVGSGTATTEDADCLPADPRTNPCNYNDWVGVDNDGLFEKLVNGGVSHQKLVRYNGQTENVTDMPLAYTPGANVTNSRLNASISYAPSVDIVITADKSKWTRCPVFELGSDASLNIGGAEAGELRKSLSVDKNGNPDGTGTGMGWFPGYAVDLETGARLFMAFGENSFYVADGGADMQWNPSARFVDGTGNPVFGGQHAIYVYGTQMLDINAYPQLGNLPNYNPATDETNNLLEQQYRILEDPSSTSPQKSAALKLSVGHLHWIAYPMLEPGEELMSTDAKIRIRINKMYKDYTATGENGGKPKYSWSMADFETEVDSDDRLAEALDMINIVPNPYYAFSEYERSRLETKVKITNLPEVCTVKIYTTNGKLVTSFKKDSPQTSLDWDMTNHKNIAVASGIYLIHVDVPGIGERVLKFFCGVRQTDLQGI